MNAFYNEIDLYAAEWMENLCAAGHINNGVVERRSIVDLRPEDVVGFTQAHFFAGIGVWSRALRLAGWPDGLPVWTGSCPCQPYSVAGKGEGVDDERHLWPDWFKLIQVCRPPVIFGEQVASKSALTWLDTVRTQLEGEGYSFGAADLASAGAGAPHIRQRLYFCAFREDVGMANANGLVGGQGSPIERGSDPRSATESRSGSRSSSSLGGLANNNNNGCQVLGPPRVHGGREPGDDADGRGEVGGLGDDSGVGRIGGSWGSDGTGFGGTPQSDRPGDARGLGDDDDEGPQGHGWNGDQRDQSRRVSAEQAGSIGAAGATRGFWSDADWLYCRDGKWRPAESGTFPLAHGAPARVGRLRAYGNAVNAELAAIFIRSAIEAFGEG